MSDKLKTHGVTATTSNDIMLGTGAYYKNLKYVESTGWAGEVLGATSGGGKLSITPEYYKPDIDGASVAVRGLTLKIGETAQLEVNVAEWKEGLMVEALHLKEDTSGTVTGYKKYISKRALDDDDYYDNIGWVGTLADGRQAIIILENALITSALELEGKNKEMGTYALTAECHASFEQDDLEHLPYQIYYPQSSEDGSEDSPEV